MLRPTQPNEKITIDTSQKKRHNSPRFFGNFPIYRSMPHQYRFVSLKRSNNLARVALLFSLISILYVDGVVADGPILANPAERFFDNEMPVPVRSSTIRQTSGDDPNVWDSPAPATPAEKTLADWGTVPALVAPTIDPQPPAPVDPTANLNTAAVDPMFGVNPYANFAQNAFVNPGFGYYNPYDTGLYANPYAMGGYNPYGNYGYDPTFLMGQQSPNYPGFGSGFNAPFPNREPSNIALASEKQPKKDTEDEEKKPGSEWTMQRLIPLKVSSPLGETLLSGMKTISPFHTPTGPDKGVGQPLVMRSWQDHPYYFGGFVGYVAGSQLVADMIDQRGGSNGGLKLGYNFNDYWGVEGRLHFASIDIRETDYGRQVYDDWYAASFPNLPYRPLTTRSNQLTMVDVSVQYYPLGNAKWRPFFTYGIGFTRESFIDTFGVNNRVDAMTMPIGIGLRYWWNEHLAIQADLVDNIVFSTGQAKTQGNVAFTVGLSYAFGMSKKCRPTAYWPYTPSMGSKW